MHLENPQQAAVSVKSSQVVLFVDVINHFEFPDGHALLRQAEGIAANLQALKRRALKAKVPVVYVNDNFSEWRSNPSQLLSYCVRPEAIGREFVSEVAPSQEDYFVLKPMHSAFYQTPLEVLLRYFEARTVVLCGLATNSCIMYTAHDARMRDFEIIVASDCCAARKTREHEQALVHIKRMAGARILQGSSIRF